MSKIEFRDFRDALKKQFDKMILNQSNMFKVEVDKELLIDTYLDSFPSGTNEIFRVKREHDCSNCKRFIRIFGGVVTIDKDYNIETIWDLDLGDDTYQPVADAMNALIRSYDIKNEFISKASVIGTPYNMEGTEASNIIRWEHLYVEIPNRLVCSSYSPIGLIVGEFRQSKEVFMRALEEFTVDGLETVLCMIKQNSVYRGSEWFEVIKSFLDYKLKYDAVDISKKELFVWRNTDIAGKLVTRLRNHSMGTLIIDVCSGMNLDGALNKYETSIMAPQNYKRPKEVYSSRELNELKTKITEEGYSSALGRRYATLEDISVNNILYVDRDSSKKLQGSDSVFDSMQKDIPVNKQKLSKVTEISIEDFIKNVLPTTTSLEVLFENSLEKNMVSLIAPIDKESKSLFRWGNNFSWAYSGNMADSSLKENVKKAGGCVTGDLRFSIQWEDMNDLDAHCVAPKDEHIFFGAKKGRKNSGELDVDIIRPERGISSVENITFGPKCKMLPGEYRMFVNCYTNRTGRTGFQAEIEFGGNIYKFNHAMALRAEEDVEVALVTLNDKGEFSIKPSMDCDSLSEEVWNLKPEQFVKVTTVMYSPNYWDEQSGRGNKHYLFMLKDCINTENPNGFYNEYLKSDFDKYKRVTASLGSKLAVASADEQLSGVGFSSTQRGEVTVRVNGAFERVLKIKF